MTDESARESLRRREEALDRYLDAAATGRLARPNPTRDQDLEQRLAATVRRIHALAGQPLPEPEFAESLWRDLMHGYAPSVPFQPVRHFPGPLNGQGERIRPLAVPVSRKKRERLSSGLSFFATVMLIAITVAMIYFISTNGRPAIIPPVQATATVVPGTPTGDWPGYGGNAARTRVASGSGPVGQPVVLWTYPPVGTTNLHVDVDRSAAADGVLYLPTATGAIVAVDATTGTEIWRVDGHGTIAIVDGDGVFVQGGETSAGLKSLARLRRSDGSVVWTSSEIAIDAAWTPVIANGVGYVPSGQDFVAFAPATGEVLWRLPLSAHPSRGATVDGGIAVMGDEQGMIYGISTESRDIVWTHDTDAAVISHPVIVNGVAYVLAAGGAEETYLALDLTTGETKWSFTSPTGAGFKNAPNDGTTAFLPSVDGMLYALDTQTGALRWRFDSGAPEIASGVVAGGTLYIPSAGGELIALDPANGAVRWRQLLDAGTISAPIVMGDVLYESTDNGTLYAIGGSESASSSGVAPVPVASPSVSSTPVATATAATGALQVQFVWATSGEGASQLRHPLMIRRSPDGQLWVADLSDRFFIFDLDGNLEDTWGAPGSGPGQFAFESPDNEMAGIAFAPDGSFYVLDPFNYRIQHFDRERVYLNEWGTRGNGDGQFLLAAGIAIEPDGNVLITDYGRSDVQRFDPNGAFLDKFDGAGSPDGNLVGPSVPVVDTSGRIFIVETDANRVRVFDHDGKQLTRFGDVGSAAASLSLNYPTDVAIDENGFAYVVDTFNNRIVVFDPNGRYVFQWGEYGMGDGQFDAPAGIAVNRGGTVYIDDWHGNRIEKFKIVGGFPAPTAATPES